MAGLGVARSAVVESPPGPARAAPAVATTAPLAPVATRRLCWGIFLVLQAIYLLTANGHLLGQDQEYYYRTARALVLERSFAIEPLGDPVESGGWGVDGR